VDSGEAPLRVRHTTPLSLEPETVATKRCMAPGARDASVGEIATEIEGAPPAVNEAATLSSAVIVNEHAPRIRVAVTHRAKPAASVTP